MADGAPAVDCVLYGWVDESWEFCKSCGRCPHSKDKGDKNE